MSSRRSKRKRDATGASPENGSFRSAPDDVSGPGHTTASAQSASQQLPTSARIERCRLLGRARSKQAQHVARMAPSGVTGAAIKNDQLDVAMSSTTPTSVETFEEVYACVITGVLPQANALLAAERDKWALQRDAKGDPTHIRDVPVGVESSSKDNAARLSYDLHTGSRVAEQLESRMAPLRQKLGVRRVARVGLKSVAPSSGALRRRRQVGHFDFEQRKCRQWCKTCRANRARVTRCWTLLVSLQDGGMLNLWCRGRWVVVHLRAGDACLFRDDTWHGGASYDCEHWRIHEYWEPVDATHVEFRRDHDGELNLHQLEERQMWERSERYIPSLSYTGPRHSIEDVMSSATLGGAFLY